MGNDMSQYSQVNVMSAYVSMIRFAMDKLELHLDELGDDILFDGLSPFPDDVLGDDSLFAGYTDPWDPEGKCDCRECRYGEYDPTHTPTKAYCDCGCGAFLKDLTARKYGLGERDYTAAEAVCDCDDCCRRNADAKIKPERMSVGNIMDMLYKTRKAPQDYRMD